MEADLLQNNVLVGALNISCAEFKNYGVKILFVGLFVFFSSIGLDGL